MRALWPEPIAEVDVAAHYAAFDRPAPTARPWVIVDMVTSVDGATAAGGVSGGLGGAGDRQVFFSLRALCDVVLVGSRTAVAENYRPARLADSAQAARHARGQPALPRIAVASASLRLDPAAPLFAHGDPIVITTANADPARKADLAAVAHIIEAGDDALDVRLALAALGDLGVGIVVCEGGPTLNGSLLNAGMVDEWCTTVAPMLVGGDSFRSVHGAAAMRRAFELASVLEDDNELYLRYTATQ